MVQRAFLMLLAIAALAAAAVPATASAAQPIEGRWNFNFGVDEFYATGPTTFASRTISHQPPCADSDLGARFAGSGSHYTGTIRYYNTTSCVFAGDGQVDITIDATGNNATMGSSEPGVACCQRTYTLTRVPLPPRDPRANRVLPDLPVILNRYLIELQARYRQILHTRNGRQHRARLRSLGSRAGQMRAAIARYRPSDGSERTLKTCAIAAFVTAAQGATIKVERAGRGLSALARCLRPFKDLAPNNTLGSGLPTPPAVSPGQRVTGGYVGNGRSVSDISFALTRSGTSLYVISFDFHVLVRCSDGRTGYLANLWRPSAYTAKVQDDGSFRASLETVGTGGGDLSEVIGRIAGGSATGTIRQRKGNCASSAESWKAAVKH